ncbi:MAG: hypothetical protein LJE84_11040, partial [Gammaproteobacteria bacterium]|nr:hypothetical protein [Gammaproteobacteria bacterium]
GRLAIDEQNRPAPGSAGTGPMSRSELIDQGIYYSRLAVDQPGRFQDPAWRYAATSRERIAIEAAALQLDESVLWQRLFEAEEGFPAAVDIPRELEGLAPW